MSAIQCSSFKVMRKLTWTQIFNLKKILIQRQYFFSEKKRGVRCLTVPPRSCLFAHFRHFVFVSVCSMALSDDSWPGGPFWLMAAHPVARFVGQSPTSNNRVVRPTFDSARSSPAAHFWTFQPVSRYRHQNIQITC